VVKLNGMLGGSQPTPVPLDGAKSTKGEEVPPLPSRLKEPPDVLADDVALQMNAAPRSEVT